MNEIMRKKSRFNDYESRINDYVREYEERVLSHLNKQFVNRSTFAQLVADKIAAFGGSWTFMAVFACFLLLWTTVNLLPVTKAIHFDEPPYILLNLILSFIAAFQAPIIMMSQSRQSVRDKQESVIDFSINYKAQQEVLEIHDHFNRLERHFDDFRKSVEEELSEIKKLLLAERDCDGE